jgi:hypothetical protein
LADSAIRETSHAWPEGAGAATPRSSKAAADADEAIAPQDRDAFGRLRRGRRNPPAGRTRKRTNGRRGKLPGQDLKGFGSDGDATAGRSGGNRPEADFGQGPGRIFGSGLGPTLPRNCERACPLASPKRRRRRRSRPPPEPGERGGFASLSNRGERRGFALVSSRAKQEGSPSCGAARWDLRVSARNPADGKRRSVRAPCATHGSRTRFRLAPEPTHPAGDRPASAARSGVWDFGGWRRRRPPCCIPLEMVLRAGLVQAWTGSAALSPDPRTPPLDSPP